jgi:heme/copper-type cytochrome/quinol oxidase subunit 3
MSVDAPTSVSADMGSSQLVSPHREAGMPTPLVGMLLFIASEVMFFAALFAAYFSIRAGFQEQDRACTVLGQSGRQHIAGRPGPYHNDVIAHGVSFTARPLSSSAPHHPFWHATG